MGNACQNAEKKQQLILQGKMQPDLNLSFLDNYVVEALNQRPYICQKQQVKEHPCPENSSTCNEAAIRRESIENFDVSPKLNKPRVWTLSGRESPCTGDDGDDDVISNAS